MRPETLRRRIDVLAQRHIDSRPMKPNTVCFAEGDESAAETLARLGIDPENFGIVVRITAVDASSPREDDA